MTAKSKHSQDELIQGVGFFKRTSDGQLAPLKIYRRGSEKSVDRLYFAEGSKTPDGLGKITVVHCDGVLKTKIEFRHTPSNIDRSKVDFIIHGNDLLLEYVTKHNKIYDVY